MSNPPLVSCLCLTRGDPTFVSNALEQWRGQSHERTELVMVHSCEKPPAPPENRLNMVRVPESLTLGDRRNVAVKRALGQYVANWDDDDHSHRDRIAVQLDMMKSLSMPAVVLDQVGMVLHVGRSLRVGMSIKRPWENTLLARRELMLANPYPSLNAEEDTELVRTLIEKQRIAWIHAPWLYTYHWHGANVVSRQHFVNLAEFPEDAWADAYVAACDHAPDSSETIAEPPGAASSKRTH